jgi:lipopolysaccharide heptosyltransferase I
LGPPKLSGALRWASRLIMPEFRRILLIKLSSLGDIINALPTAAALRRVFPSASVTWLVKREWAEVLEANPHIDRVMTLDFSMRGWSSAVAAIRSVRFDLAVDLQGLFRSALLGWLSGAPVRVGFAAGREGSSWFYTRRVPMPPSVLHAVDRCLMLARDLGASPEAAGLEFPLPEDPAAESRVSRWLFAQGVAPGAVLAAVNPSPRWPTKQWSPASFAAVADRLQTEGVVVVIVGAPADRSVVDDVIGRMRQPPVDLCGKTGLKDLIALFRRLQVVITNDSGPMHLAAALGTPVVAIFGPTDPARNGPYGPGHVVLQSGIPCSPCFRRRCLNPVEMECMTAIGPDQVTQKALEVIWGSRGQDPKTIRAVPRENGPSYGNRGRLGGLGAGG